MSEDQIEAVSASVFLQRVGEALSGAEGIDTELAAILASHILTDSPTSDAVARAKAAIVQLASERGQSIETGAEDA